MNRNKPLEVSWSYEMRILVCWNEGIKIRGLEPQINFFSSHFVRRWLNPVGKSQTYMGWTSYGNPHFRLPATVRKGSTLEPNSHYLDREYILSGGGRNFENLERSSLERSSPFDKFDGVSLGRLSRRIPIELWTWEYKIQGRSAFTCAHFLHLGGVCVLMYITKPQRRVNTLSQ